MDYSKKIISLYEEPSEEKIVKYLETEDQDELTELYEFADLVRKSYVGDEIHIRGIIEFTNYCKRSCLYCGINRNNQDIKRYRMTVEEILERCVFAWNKGFKTVVLQGGEDPFYQIDDYIRILKGIKNSTNLAVTMAIGEKTEEEYKKMFESGAERFLLKHETSDPDLYSRLNPGMFLSERISCLKILKKIGFETGSGIMIGLPGQSLKSIAADILLFKELDIDMIGCGPFIPHPSTPLKESDQMAEDLTYRVLALNRIVTRNTNLPSTTALSTINEHDAREKALKRGANVIMPNLTPMPYRQYYEIYPNKKRTEVSSNEFMQELRKLAEKLGRKISISHGFRNKNQSSNLLI